MSAISRNLLGPYPHGVPTPRHIHVHPYPTRYHGSINTRPWFNFPYREQPHAVFKPDDFYQEGPVQGLGALQYQTGRGIFLPQGNGGGIFDMNISGVGSTGLGYSVSNLPWKSYSADTASLQSDINKALVKLGKSPITVDGKLGPNTCTAAQQTYAAIARGDITGDFGSLAVPPECSKSHGTTTTSSLPTTVSTSTEAATLPPPPSRMSSGTKNILVFGGAAVLALGGALLIMKGMKKRKG